MRLSETSFKCHNEVWHYKEFGMLSLSGHMVLFERDGGQWEHRVSKDVRIETGYSSEQPFMQIADSNHVVDEINFAVKNMVEETNEQLDEQGSNVVMNEQI